MRTISKIAGNRLERVAQSAGARTRATPVIGCCEPACMTPIEQARCASGDVPRIECPRDRLVALRNASERLTNRHATRVTTHRDELPGARRVDVLHKSVSPRVTVAAKR